MSEEINIPKHWQIKTLGEVCVFSQGIQVDVTHQSLEKNKDQVRFLRIIDFTQGDDPYRYIDNPGGRYYIKKDDIAMVRYGTVGFVCTGKEGIIANNLFKIEPDEKISKKFLIHFLQSELFRRKLETKGATMQALSFGLIKPIQIPIPPLPEQQAIVSKIEELLSDLENGKQQLQIAQQQLKIYRQSLLKWAFQGKLTNKHFKDGELPKGWKWKEIREITSVLGDGLHGTPKYSETGEYFFINGNNLSDGKIEIKENTKCVSVEEYEKYKKPLNERTIFVSINGSLGYTAFYSNEKVILGKSACYFNVIDSIDKHYIRYFITSNTFTSYANKNATGSTIKNVGLKTMREFKVPIPPTLEEQQLIVDELESKLTVCDKIEETISQSLLQAESLRQSILKKAFSGELV